MEPQEAGPARAGLFVVWGRRNYAYALNNSSKEQLKGSDALRMMLTRVAREQSLPFEPLVPNATTIKAMRDARSGKITKHKSLDALMADLHAGN